MVVTELAVTFWLIERWRKVEIGVGLHLRQTDDGGVGDDRGTVEDVSEVFGSSLKNLCLFGEQGTAVGAEKRSSCLGCGTVDSLDREEVPPFVAVRVSLDLFGLANRPSLLRLAQLLLHRAATTVESSSVVVDGVFDVGFVQSVLLSEQDADGGVVVVEPVLVLASCVTEDNQDHRLECVPQLTPSVPHGGVHVNGGGGGY
ncbi:hypothetical protein SprV_0100173300 [Sparganum proliferum]